MKDFSLHKNPQRGHRYQYGDGIWWSVELKRWMISDLGLISQVLRNPDFVVHEYRFDLALSRHGVHLPHLTRMREFLPLAVEGERHSELRNRMIREISLNTVAAVEAYEAALAAALDETIVRSRDGTACLARDVLLPSLRKASIVLAGLAPWLSSIDEIEHLADLPLFFDDLISIKKRMQLEAIAAQVLHAMPADMDVDERYLRLSMLTLAIDTLSASVTLSVKSILEREPGVALNQVNWDAELTSTGLPFIERKAAKDALLLDKVISRNDRVRLLVDAAGFQGNACPRYSDLYFAAGAHQCIGKAASRKIWKSTVEQLRMINRCLQVTAFSFRGRDTVFSFPESFEVTIHERHRETPAFRNRNNQGA
jgi:hypothetical protein